MNACYALAAIIFAGVAAGFPLYCAMRARGSEWSE